MCDCKIVTIKYILWCKKIFDLPAKRYDRAVLKSLYGSTCKIYKARERNSHVCKSQYPCTRRFVLVSWTLQQGFGAGACEG